MTKNSARKSAARAYQRLQPGVTFPEAVRATRLSHSVDLTVCPLWCEDHYDAEPTEPDAGASHYSRRWALPVDGEGDGAEVEVQLTAFDNTTSRLQLADLILPDGEYASMSSRQARRVADVLEEGATAREVLVPGIGRCPAWCVSHGEDELGADDPRAHFGGLVTVAAYGPDRVGAYAGYQLQAFDLEGTERVVLLALAVQREFTDVNTSQAREIVTRLRAAADTLDAC